MGRLGMPHSTLSNLRFLYFVRNLARFAIPGAWFRSRLAPTLTQLDHEDLRHVTTRAAYYNRVHGHLELGEAASPWRWSAFRKQRNYCFDLLEHLRAFDPDLRLHYRFGDDTRVPDVPTIVKARPIAGDNANAVLFKLNKIRHFRFVHDRVPFARKRDQVVWRGKGRQPHREVLLAACHGRPGCDVARVDAPGGNDRWTAPRMSIEEQLASKFVLSVEGNDVATNLKWIFSSNSACMMRRPQLESWFQEGTLVPEHHYIELADDFSDVEDKVRFYSRRTDLAEHIVRNAQAHSVQFRDERRERAISLLVLLRYFEASGQIAPGTFGARVPPEFAPVAAHPATQALARES